MPLRALDGLGGLEGLAANEGGGGAGHRRVRSGPDHGRGGAERGEGGGSEGRVRVRCRGARRGAGVGVGGGPGVVAAGGAGRMCTMCTREGRGRAPGGATDGRAPLRRSASAPDRW